MEFRQVVSICRSAAATTTRPSLARTRPSPSSILLQRHHFTTNNKQRSEAAAVAAQPQSDATINPRSLAYKVAQLQASLSQSQSSMPPRPPIRRSNMIEGAQRNSWATPQSRNGANRSSLFGGRTTLTGRAPAASTARDLFSLPSQIASDMERATGNNTANSTDKMSTWEENAFLPKHFDVAEAELRLRPSTGRTIHIKGSVDLARGFRLLGRAVSQNKIKSDVRLTKFHERPALKRKRLKRERWQARFKNGFRATIQRVMELKAQGW